MGSHVSPALPQEPQLLLHLGQAGLRQLGAGEGPVIGDGRERGSFFGIFRDSFPGKGEIFALFPVCCSHSRGLGGSFVSQGEIRRRKGVFRRLGLALGPTLADPAMPQDDGDENGR